ncbi:MAG: branched-chain amino acid ABC transporter permease, partial [Granulicatella sp.]
MRNMQRFHQKNLIWLASAVVIYLLLQVLVQVGVINFYYESTFISIMINIIFAVGLNLILGVAGQFSLGHAGFIAIGAYSAAIIGKAVSGLAGLFAGMAVGVVISIVIAYLVGLPTLRLKGDYLAIATLGVAEIIRVALNNMKITNGAAGISGIPLTTTWTIVYIALVLTT